MTTHHTFFNFITLPEGKEEAAIAAWRAVGEYMEQQQGFLGSMLYRNTRNGRILINHGRYESVESFMASVRSPKFQQLSQALTDLGVERVAGLYDPVHAFGSGADWS